ncbi:MAG: ANTAR domain-containing protein [Acholeplasmatales bacterium]|nr:ANTAR domain-containing protein [Acholeplasmatales bacterium]
MLERIFRILLISSSKNFSLGISNALMHESYEIEMIDSIAKAKRKVLECDFDIIMINSPVIDDFGLDFAIEEAITNVSGILMFVKPELEAEIYYKTYQYGILTLTKPSTKTILLQSLRLLGSTIAKREQIYNKPKNINERLEEIKIINTAKLLLIEHMNLTEDEAHKYLEKKAMDFRQSKIKIAKNIIDEYYKK